MNLDTLIACAACGYTLTEERDHDGRTIYRHPVSETDRHQPVPINAALVTNIFHRCHVCSGPHPVWNYRTSMLEAQAISGTQDIIQTYNTQWHVCYRCAQVIEADDPSALTARSAAVMGWRPQDPHYAILHIVHRAIVLTREHRTLLTTTEWPPARITPEMLPKVRDRLTGLLRGPTNLPDAINNSDDRRSLADHLDRTPMYWINQEFTNRVNQVSDAQPPAWINNDLIPSLTGLLAWPEPVGNSRRLGAITWTPRGDGLDLIAYRTIGGGVEEDLMPALRHELGWLIPVHAEHLRYGTTIDGRHPLGPLTTTWLQISQQLTETTIARLPKGTTRAYQRANRPAPKVRIVQIKPRAATPEPPITTDTQSRKRARPDHRFWVSGHDRNQAYGPGRSLRRKIEIQPFLKGDEDLPIKLSTTVRTLGSRRIDEKHDDR